MASSPGGQLLRASRVFAIPKPLPIPPATISSVANFQSDTATVPYPTHQSITTTQSSQHRGDWGFKRPFPLRSTTRTTTPLIKIKAIDTYEHVTDFASAADHTLTLRKWQEIGLPLYTPPSEERRQNKAKPRSVFEDDIDTIAPTNGNELGASDARWKFKGPWLAGMTDSEFNAYVKKSVASKRLAFQKFLRVQCAYDLTLQQIRMAPEREGEVLPPVEPNEVTDEQFIRYVKGLRENPRDIEKLVREFLDIPPVNNLSFAASTEKLLADLSLGRDRINIKAEDHDHAPFESPYADNGPPKTHPSAGLAYGRTSSHLFNHPVWGPQASHPPVKARIVNPKDGATGTFQPVFGVGGFITAVPPTEEGWNWGTSGARSSSTTAPIPGLVKMLPNAPGGTKAWVSPASASIDIKGHVVMVVKAPKLEAVAVQEGTTDSIPRRDDTRHDGLKLPWGSTGTVARSMGGSLFGTSSR